MANRISVADPTDDEFAVRVVAVPDMAVTAVIDRRVTPVAVSMTIAPLAVTMTMAAMAMPVTTMSVAMCRCSRCPEGSHANDDEKRDELT